MTFARLVLTPIRTVTAIATAGAVAAIVVRTPASDLPAAVVGAAAGLLAVLAASQLGLLASVPLVGVRVQRVVVGFGPRVSDWTTAKRTLTLRAFPVMLTVVVRAARAPVRARMWASALCATCAELAVVVLAALGDGPFLHGFAIAALAELANSLLPRRTAGTTSMGWLLFRLPRLSADQARQLDAVPLAGEAVDLARNGELAAAERVVARLLARFPDVRPSLTARIVVLRAQARYPEALVLAVRLIADARQPPDEAAGSYAALAGLAAVTVEAGQLETELGLSTATSALASAGTLGYPNHRLNGVRALLELLRGNPARAITLARIAAATADDLLARADHLATLARAHMACGDNQTARRVIGEAEKLASWWPRVAGTRSRLEVC